MPSNADLAAMLSKIASDLADVKREVISLSKAFPTNDLGEPDFDGHRKAHVGMIAAAKVMDGYKVEVTKKLVGYVTIFAIGIMTTGALQAAREWFAPPAKVNNAAIPALQPK